MHGMYRLDETDIEILILLQKDGRISNVSLSESVGLSPSPCLQRVKRLEKAGLIESYEARINLKKITNALTVFTEVTLIGHERTDFQRFEQAMSAVPELMECHLITGGYDYLLRFVARNIEHYQDVILSVIDKKVGIAKYFSYIVINSPVVKNALPLPALIKLAGANE